jgi:hypothetical protein
MNDSLARPASSGVSFGGQSFGGRSLGDQSFGGQAGVARCSICELPVSLEAAKTDEYGRAIHEECYARKMGLKAATSPSAA